MSSNSEIDTFHTGYPTYGKRCWGPLDVSGWSPPISIQPIAPGSVGWTAGRISVGSRVTRCHWTQVSYYTPESHLFPVTICFKLLLFGSAMSLRPVIPNVGVKPQSEVETQNPSPEKTRSQTQQKVRRNSTKICPNLNKGSLQVIS